jgi:hypothetical protein
MQRNDILDDQKTIFKNLLEETVREYAGIPGKETGKIVIGANETTFTFRNSGCGILSGKVARGVLPAEDGTPPDGPISPQYDLEQYLSADVFELHSFHSQETSILIYEKSERKSFNVYPDTSTPEGILVHIEWRSRLEPEQVLTVQDVFSALLKMFPLKSSRARLRWEPEVWFNATRIQY